MENNESTPSLLGANVRNVTDHDEYDKTASPAPSAQKLPVGHHHHDDLKEYTTVNELTAEGALITDEQEYAELLDETGKLVAKPTAVITSGVQDEGLSQETKSNIIDSSVLQPVEIDDKSHQDFVVVDIPSHHPSIDVADVSTPADSSTSTPSIYELKNTDSGMSLEDLIDSQLASMSSLTSDLQRKISDKKSKSVSQSRSRSRLRNVVETAIPDSVIENDSLQQVPAGAREGMASPLIQSRSQSTMRSPDQSRTPSSPFERPHLAKGDSYSGVNTYESRPGRRTDREDFVKNLTSKDYLRSVSRSRSRVDKETPVSNDTLMEEGALVTDELDHDPEMLKRVDLQGTSLAEESEEEQSREVTEEPDVKLEPEDDLDAITKKLEDVLRDVTPLKTSPLKQQQHDDEPEEDKDVGSSATDPVVIDDESDEEVADAEPEVKEEQTQETVPDEAVKDEVAEVALPEETGADETIAEESIADKAFVEEPAEATKQIPVENATETEKTFEGASVDVAAAEEPEAFASEEPASEDVVVEEGRGAESTAEEQASTEEIDGTDEGTQEALERPAEEQASSEEALESVEKGVSDGPEATVEAAEVSTTDAEVPEEDIDETTTAGVAEPTSSIVVTDAPDEADDNDVVAEASKELETVAPDEAIEGASENEPEETTAEASNRSDAEAGDVEQKDVEDTTDVVADAGEDVAPVEVAVTDNSEVANAEESTEKADGSETPETTSDVANTADVSTSEAKAVSEEVSTPITETAEASDSPKKSITSPVADETERLIKELETEIGDVSITDAESTQEKLIEEAPQQTNEAAEEPEVNVEETEVKADEPEIKAEEPVVEETKEVKTEARAVTEEEDEEMHEPTKEEIIEILKDEPVYIYTSLAGGGFFMPQRTNKLITILTANRVPYTLRDLGTDEEARNVWRRYGKGRSPPGVVRGKDDIIGNWEEIEEANEEYRVRELIYETL